MQNNIDTISAALMLIDILYKEQRINEQTYKAILKKYGRGSHSEAPFMGLLVIVLIVGILVIYFMKKIGGNKNGKSTK